LLLCLPAAGAFADGDRGAPVRIGLTPVFLDDQAAFLGVWREYLERRLHRKVAFFQRGSYREITEMVRQGELDFAWICGLPYVRNRGTMTLVAVPLYNGRPLYQSYLIVPAADDGTRSLRDLRGKVFALSDPDSNSGYLYPTYTLAQLGESNATFFKKTFFTWAHRKVVEAVASGLADGGAVDGYVWETLKLYHPELTEKTRVVQKSPDFGHTPVVARASLPARDLLAMREVLVSMAADAEGRELLRRLNLDGFTFAPDSERLFDGIARMARVVVVKR
jgi:phosphonate transport system substrate-binding protein